VYLDLLEVQKVRWENGGTKQGEEFKFSLKKVNVNRHLGTGFVVRKRITSVVKMREIVRNRTLSTVLSGFLRYVVRKTRVPVEDVLLLIIFWKGTRL
jgi:hypothetical protein